MIQIDLDLGGARVTNDEFNYIISLKKVKGKGKDAGSEYWLPVSYHGSLEQVAKNLAQHAAEGVDVADSGIFDKITKLLEGEQHRLLNRLLNKLEKKRK